MKFNKLRPQSKIILCIAVAVFILCSFVAESFGVWDYLNERFLIADSDKSDYIRFLSVGQSECTVFHSGDIYGAVDIGNSNDDGIAIVNSLRSNNVKALDFLIISHAHSDHLGGLIAVAENIKIKQLFCMDGTFEDSGKENRFYSVIKENNIKVTTVKAGDRITCGGFAFDIIYSDTTKSGNDRSLVFTANYGDKTIFFGGDISSSTEKKMLKNGFNTKCDVMKANHHGSNSSNSSEFLKTVSPQYIIAMCGKDNDYGFPGKKFLARADAVGAKVLSTSKYGDITYYLKTNKIVYKQQ